VRTARDLARAYLAARGSRRPTVPFRLPGTRFTAFRSGANLVPGEPYGHITFEEHLAATETAGRARAGGRDTTEA
jgi:hypothetical protein